MTMQMTRLQHECAETATDSYALPARRETDAWSRAAEQVRAQATRLGLALDEEELALQDVRALQALHASLQGRRAGRTGTALLGLRAPRWATVLALRA